MEWHLDLRQIFHILCLPWFIEIFLSLYKVLKHWCLDERCTWILSGLNSDSLVLMSFIWLSKLANTDFIVNKNNFVFFFFSLTTLNKIHTYISSVTKSIFDKKRFILISVEIENVSFKVLFNYIAYLLQIYQNYIADFISIKSQYH